MKITSIDANAVWLWTTPTQLRALADQMERHMKQVALGGDTIIKTVISKKGRELRIAYDQDQKDNSRATPAALTKTLEYNKCGQRHFIHYEIGSEKLVLESLIEKASRRELDWFDLSVLAHHLGVRLTKKLKSQFPPS